MIMGLAFHDFFEIVAAHQMSMFLEVSGEPKPGNVTPSKALPEMAFEDMAAAIVSIGKPLAALYEKARTIPKQWEAGLWGGGLLSCCRAACRKTNTLFGSLLLQIPVGLGALWAGEKDEVLKLAGELVRSSTVKDSLWFVKAASKSRVGGLKHRYLTNKETRELDITRPGVEDTISSRDITLFDLLSRSASYDLISSELVSGFPLTKRGSVLFSNFLNSTHDPLKASSLSFCNLLSEVPDSLIARKSGKKVAEKVRRMAKRAMRHEAFSPPWLDEMDGLDRHLRESDLNPGALADITAAGILLFLLGVPAT